MECEYSDPVSLLPWGQRYIDPQAAEPQIGYPDGPGSCQLSVRAASTGPQVLIVLARWCSF